MHESTTQQREVRAAHVVWTLTLDTGRTTPHSRCQSDQTSLASDRVIILGTNRLGQVQRQSVLNAHHRHGD